MKKGAVPERMKAIDLAPQFEVAPRLPDSPLHLCKNNPYQWTFEVSCQRATSLTVACRFQLREATVQRLEVLRQ